MAMATFTPRNATLSSTVLAGELARTAGMNVTMTTAAAVANHLSCSRSSPSDRMNRTATAATLTAIATGTRASSRPSTPGCCALAKLANGRAYSRVAPAIAATRTRVKTDATNHAAGRQRRDRSRPAGNSRNTNATAAVGMTQMELATHMAASPPGSDPGAAARARSP